MTCFVLSYLIGNLVVQCLLCLYHVRRMHTFVRIDASNDQVSFTLLDRKLKRKQRRRVRPRLCSGANSVLLFDICATLTCLKQFFYFDLLNVVCFLLSHLGPPKRRTTAEEEERAKNPKPEVRNAWFVTAFEFLLIPKTSQLCNFFVSGLCLLPPNLESYWGPTTRKASNVSIIDRYGLFRKSPTFYLMD